MFRNTQRRVLRSDNRVRTRPSQAMDGGILFRKERLRISRSDNRVCTRAVDGSNRPSQGSYSRGRQNTTIVNPVRVDHTVNDSVALPNVSQELVTQPLPLTRALLENERRKTTTKDEPRTRKCEYEAYDNSSNDQVRSENLEETREASRRTPRLWSFTCLINKT